MSRAWMPLYVADYLADTTHLSAAEHGAYLLLIMHYWQNGELPTDDRRLARIARMGTKEWNKARPTLAEFFDAGWKHARVEAEIGRANEVSDRARSKAEKRWKNNDTPDAAASPRHVPQPCQSQSQSQREETSVSSNAREAEQPSERRQAASRETDQEFDLWYAGYPHKIGKADARKAFAKARRKASLAELVAGRDRYIRTKPPDRSWCNPATFLNQERWTDEPSTDDTKRPYGTSPGHRSGEARGGAAVLAAMADFAHRRGLSYPDRGADVEPCSGDPCIEDADWRDADGDGGPLFAARGHGGGRA